VVKIKLCVNKLQNDVIIHAVGRVIGCVCVRVCKQASISNRISLSKFARWQNGYVSLVSLGVDTAAQSGLYARFYHAFLVSSVLYIQYNIRSYIGRT